MMRTRESRLNERDGGEVNENENERARKDETRADAGVVGGGFNTKIRVHDAWP